MRETIYFQRNAADPILSDELVLEIVRFYVPDAKAVTGIDESGGEGRVYSVDENIILKVQRPQQLRSSTSLERETFFLEQIRKQTNVNIPHVLGYGKKDDVEYICMTRMPGLALEGNRLPKKQKRILLYKLGRDLRQIHDMDQQPFIDTGVFPCDEPEDLVERLQRCYYRALEKKGCADQVKLEEAKAAVDKELESIVNPGGFVALHLNPYIPHVFIDPVTLEYNGIIDFGDAFIGHPIMDMWYWTVPSRSILMEGYTAEKPISEAFQNILDTLNAVSQMVHDFRS